MKGMNYVDLGVAGLLPTEQQVQFDSHTKRVSLSGNVKNRSSETKSTSIRTRKLKKKSGRNKKTGGGGLEN